MADLSSFSYIVKWSIACSLYIPGTTLIFKKSYVEQRLIFIYCFMSLLLIFFISLDQILLMVASDLPTIEICGALFLFVGFFWSFIIRLFFFFNGSRIVKVLEYWAQNFNNDLNVQLMKQEMTKKLGKKLKWTICVLMIFVGGPMFSVALGKITWTRALYFRSILDQGNYFSDSDLRILVFQAANAIYINISWVMSEAILFQLVSMLVVEYTVLNNGLADMLLMASRTSDHKMLIQQLKTWTVYHSKVLKLRSMIDQIYRPFLLGHFIHIVVANCGIIFNTIAIKMPADIQVLSYIYVLPRLVMTQRLCTMADSLITLSRDTLDMLQVSNWLDLPVLIQKNILIIREICLKQTERALTVPPKVVLNLHTFQRAMLVQYRFFTFLQDIERRAGSKP